MGCSSSKLDAVDYGTGDISKARTETTGIWDADFRLPPQSRPKETLDSNISNNINNSNNNNNNNNNNSVQLLSHGSSDMNMHSVTVTTPLINNRTEVPANHLGASFAANTHHMQVPFSNNSYHSTSNHSRAQVPPSMVRVSSTPYQHSVGMPMPMPIPSHRDVAPPADASPTLRSVHPVHEIAPQHPPQHQHPPPPVEILQFETAAPNPLPSSAPPPTTVTIAQQVVQTTIPTNGSGGGGRPPRPNQNRSPGSNVPGQSRNTGMSIPPRPTSPKRPLQQHRNSIAPNNDDRFEDYYIAGEELGKGSFATVFFAIEKVTQQKFAVKMIRDRSKMKWNGRDALVDEIQTLERLRSAPNVVYMHDYFMDPKQCFLILELLPGKELFDRIIQRGTYTEEEARNSCRCILEALAYMHERRMTHRDLKPENLLLADESDTARVKLSDFGFSKTITTRNECRTLCGTPGYLAPEILEKWPAYDVKCDVWSFGVILFLMLGGYLPFDSHGTNDTKQVFENTRNGQYVFYPQRWQTISRWAKELVVQCLTVNPNKRISSSDALMHPWMGDGLVLPKTQISAVSLSSTVEKARRERHEKRIQAEYNHANRLQELNDDFTVFLDGRQGDSVVSHLTGVGKSVMGLATVATFQTQFREESPSGLPFSNFYQKGPFLGSGGFATVYRCMHKRSGANYAVKEVDKSKLSKVELRTLQEEIVVLKYLRGAPYIIRLYDVFVEQSKTYMILEEMRGGDLLNRIGEKEVYTEREARQLCKILFLAVNYCHKKKIAHRDIKLDNLLLQETGNDASIKLADFGFAKKVIRPNCLKTLCGTPNYMAPEIFEAKLNGYDYRCDMWSVGVVVFALLGGYLPFEGDIKSIASQVLHGEVYFHEEYWMSTSPSAKKLIKGLLQKDPSARLSAGQALASRWMGLDDSALSVLDLSITKSRLTSMTAKKKVQNVVRGIMGASKLQAAASIASAMRGETKNDMGSIVEGEDEMEFEISFQDVYTMGHETGEGIFEKIRVATAITSHKEYSVKKVVRHELHPSDVAALNDEIEVLKEIADGGEKLVVCLHEVYEDPDATYLVFERFRGQILIDRLIEHKKYTEFDAKELIRSLLMGVSHCHQRRIAIRNLTLDNLLLPSGRESSIIITDFEFSKKVLFPNSLHTQCGTQEFVAPEVLENRPAYDVSCDMWSVGVILFILLGGYYPFRGKDDEEKLRNVRYGNFEFRDRLWKGITEDAKQLLRMMMTVNPEGRVTAEGALASSWMYADNLELSADLTECVAEMKREVERKFKSAVNAVIATNKLELLPHQSMEVPHHTYR